MTLKKGDSLTLDELEFWEILEEPKRFSDEKGDYLIVKLRKHMWNDKWD